MPEAPTPPKPISVVARWMMVSFTHPPPKDRLPRTSRCAARLRVKR